MESLFTNDMSGKKIMAFTTVAPGISEALAGVPKDPLSGVVGKPKALKDPTGVRTSNRE